MVWGKALSVHGLGVLGLGFRILVVVVSCVSGNHACVGASGFRVLKLRVRFFGL